MTTAGPLSAERASVDYWRLPVLDLTMSVFLPAGAIVVAMVLVRDVQRGDVLRDWLPALFAWGLIATLTTRRTLPYRVRAGAVLVAPLGVGALDFVHHGYFADSRLALFAGCLLSGILLGRAWGVAALLASTALLSLVPLHVLPLASPATDFHAPAAWATAACVYALLSATVIAPVTLLWSRLADSLDEAGAFVASEQAAQRAAEEALRALESSQLLTKSIIDNSSAAILVRDLSGTFVLANPEFERLFDVRHAGIVGRSVSEVFPADLARSFAETDRQVASGGEAIHLTLMLPVGDTTRTFLTVKFPVRDASGAVSGIGAISTDVTLLREAERALAEHEAMFARIFELYPDPIGLSRVDDARFVEVNPGFCNIMGYSREEALGKNSLELGMWEDPAGRVRAMEAILIRGEDRAVPVRVRCKDGTVRDCEFRGTIIEQGGERLVLAVVRDVTEQRRAEAALVRLNEELEAEVTARTRALEHTNRELDAFSRAVSHDLRTPLNDVRDRVARLHEELDESADAETKRLLDVIDESAGRMDTLIDDLLRFARLGRVELSVADVDLNALVSEVQKEVAAAAPNRKIAWHLLPLPTVRGDRALLRQVLVNLIGNAVKYTREHADANIEIGGRALPDGGHEIWVKDDGVGFDPRYADRLFGVFQRLHPNFEGTGVGLANVLRIVRRHGGSVAATGEVGRGATFSFRLP